MARDERDAADDGHGEAAAGTRANVKLQRWVDLLAALLVRVHPATFEELAKDVPEYWLRLRDADAEPDDRRRATQLQTLKRTFERDKDELREFGVPIESVPDESGNPVGAYRLRRKDFYLPYLCFAVPGGGVRRPERPDRWGYQALTALTFEPDELQAVVDAAACVRGLGDPLLAADAASALRKLAVDLPVDDTPASPDEPRVLLPRTQPGAPVFEALGDALARRKTVRFTYHAMSTDRREEREVEPYGLFFLNGHWYLAARDLARDELRNFRLNRVSAPVVNGRRPQSADYEIPPTFRLREHARSRQAWELGGQDAVRVVVELAAHSGPSRAAARLGQPVEGHEARRAFEVRRVDAFVRWLLSFAGDVVPVEPPDVVRRYRDAAAAVAGLYAARRDDVVPPPADATAAPPASVDAPMRRRGRGARADEAWQPTGAAAQLRRILHVVPQIADGEEHPLADVATRIGSDAATLRRDLYSLVTRFDVPPGFVDGVQLYVESDRVSAVSNHLLRPMRLTVSELCALELGLAVLHARRPPDEQPVIDRARDRLRSVIAKLPDDPIPDGLHGASLGEHGSTADLAAVRTALRERRKLRLDYWRSGAAEASRRVVCPLALVAANGMVYVIAHGDGDEAIRVFRMDRVEGAETLDETFEPRAGVSLDAVLRDGRVFHRDDAGTMRVRYSPRIARWIAEREGRPLAADGSLELLHPLADGTWALRHVLQYGPEAEVLEPAALREAVRDRLGVILRTLPAGDA